MHTNPATSIGQLPASPRVAGGSNAITNGPLGGRSTGDNSIDLIMGDDDGDGDGISAAKGTRSVLSHRTQDEDDEDVAVSALWALSANATAENSPEPLGSLQADPEEKLGPGQHGRPRHPDSHLPAHPNKDVGNLLRFRPEGQRKAPGEVANRQSNGSCRVVGKAGTPHNMMRIAAEAQARQWLSIATWGSKPASQMGLKSEEEHVPATHSSKGSATNTSSPHAPEQLPFQTSSKEQAPQVLQAEPADIKQSPGYMQDQQGLHGSQNDDCQQQLQDAHTCSGSSFTTTGLSGKMPQANQEAGLSNGTDTEAGHAEQLHGQDRAPCADKTQAATPTEPFPPAGRAPRPQGAATSEKLTHGPGATSPDLEGPTFACDPPNMLDMLNRTKLIQAHGMGPQMLARQLECSDDQLLAANMALLQHIHAPALATDAKRSSHDIIPDCSQLMPLHQDAG